MKLYFTRVLNLFFIASVFLASCSKDNSETNENIAINDFSTSYLSELYLWNEQISSNLVYNKNSDPVDYFNSLLYNGTSDTFDPILNVNRNGDRWSFLTDDYQGLIDYFNGQRISAGYYLYAYLFDSNSDRLVLVPAYVYENSPAGLAGLKRGDIITKIDNTEIYNSNVNDLLSNTSFSLTLGDLVNDVIVERSDNVSLTKTEFTINPILHKEVFDVAGTKIAYLLYNSFIGGMDQDLINAFQEFKDQGATELVLDLRYNSGGSVTTAVNLASMIAPSSAIGQIFLKKVYNSKLQAQFLADPNYGESYLNDNLVSNAIGYEGDAFLGTSLPNLNLNRLYVIGTDNTASASELIINGLKPYMNVITIGSNTHGKYTASVTLQNNTYENWAMQLIVFKSANANNQSDYWNGFAADFELDDIPAAGDFGYDVNSDTYEGMLASAIENITGVSGKANKVDGKFYQGKKIEYFQSKLNYEMYDRLKFSLPVK